METMPEPGPPIFEVHRDGAEGRFRLLGEVDMRVSPRLIEELGPALRGTGDVSLDLSELRFIDSSGIHAMFEIAEELGTERHLVLHSPRGEVERLLELVGAHRLPNVIILADQGEVDSAR